MSLSLLLRRNNLFINASEEAEQLDTDGLIAYWSAEDAAVSGKWIDRINSFQLQLGGTAGQTSDGYRFNNLSTPKAAYAIFPSSQNSALNSLVNKEFTCFIDCLIKFSNSSKSACIIDFGSLGSSLSGISVLAAISRGGSEITGNMKSPKNTYSNFSSRTSSATGANAITLNQYANISIKCGVRILQNNTQEVYAEALGLKAYGIIDTPVKVNFQGCSGSINCAFGLGITYLTGNSISMYGSSYLADVIYKSVRIYNKSK